MSRRDSLPGAGIEPAWGFPQEILRLLVPVVDRDARGLQRTPKGACASACAPVPKGGGSPSASFGARANESFLSPGEKHPERPVDSAFSPHSAESRAPAALFPVAAQVE